MRVGITGGSGMLATALRAEFADHGHEVLTWTRSDLDVTDEMAARRVIEDARPDAVIQCAAYTRVDDAESDEATANRVNVSGARNVAAACAHVGALFVYPSTDYVFSGEARAPYRPEDPTGPISAYGCSKLAGEVAARLCADALIVRTSWLYGDGGGHFVGTIARLARERDRLEVVDDQIGRPTSTRSLAEVMRRLVESRAYGTFHATDSGEPVSWYRFAIEILERLGIPTPIVPVPTERYRRPAPRPAYSVLDCSATEAFLASALPDWRESLGRYLAAAGPR